MLKQMKKHPSGCFFHKYFDILYVVQRFGYKETCILREGGLDLLIDSLPQREIKSAVSGIFGEALNLA